MHQGQATSKTNPEDISTQSDKISRLKLVHSDLCGPFLVVTVNGSKYIMTLIDDYTCNSWVYLLKRKSIAFNNFKVFKAIVENQFGHSVSCFWSDKGGEYVLNFFFSILTNIRDP